MKKLMMALVLMPLMALAGGEEVVLDFRTMEVDGIEWTYFVHDGLAEDGRADIKNLVWCEDGWYEVAPAIPTETQGAITVPSVFGESMVACIGSGAFHGCSGLTSVTIPSNVESIVGGIFWGCDGLTSIIVADANAAYSSQDGVLYDKTKTMLIACPPGKVGEFVIQSGVTTIEEGAFAGCGGLTAVTMPSSVTSIRGAAFHGCVYLKTIYVANGDAQRIKNMLSGSGMDVSGLQFVESGTGGEGGDEDCGGECSPTEDDGGGSIVSDPFDGNVKHVFVGLVRDKKKEPCGLIQVTTAKATAKGVKVSGFVMLEDGKKATMKAVTVAVEKNQLKVSTTVGKLGGISLTIGGKGFDGTLGDMKVATEKVGEDTGILKATVKMSYFEGGTGKLKSRSVKLTGITVDGAAAGTLTTKGRATKEFVAEIK